MNNPTIFSYFGPDTNELLMEVALTIEPEIFKSEVKIEDMIVANMGSVLGDMYDAKVQLGVTWEDWRMANELRKLAPEYVIGERPRLSRHQLLEVLKKLGPAWGCDLTNAKTFFKFLIVTPAFRGLRRSHVRV